MFYRKAKRILAACAAVAMATLGVSVVSAAPASAETLASTICYNTSQAGPFASTANQAASIWNGSTSNINMSRCGSNLMVYYTYGGGSYAVRYSLGNGYVVIDYYQAQQYSPLRIMTHEMGHILGLPDNYNGDCSLLMSGGSAGTSCTNPYPRWDEADRVDALFGFALTAKDAGTQIFQDSWPASSPVKVG